MKNKKKLNIVIAATVAIICGTIFSVFFTDIEKDFFKYYAENTFTITPDTTLSDNRISSDFHLKPAEYILKIRYKSDSDTALALRSISSYVAERDGWAVLLEKPLSKGEQELEFSFTADQFYYDVMAVSMQSEPVNLEIYSISIESKSPVVYDSYGFSVAFGVIIFIFALAILKIIGSQDSKKEKYQQIFVLLILAIVFLLCTRYMWGSGTIMGDDVKFHQSRIQSIAQSFSIGQIPSMTGTGFNDGYGYMNSAFYPELFMYFPGFLVFLGISGGSAMKIFALFASLAGCFICYYSFYKISQSRSAAVSCSSIYMLSFYRMQNFYIRMAIGEFLFMIYMPLVIYGIYNIIYEKRKKWWILAIGCGGVLQSHMLGTAFTAVIGGIIITVCLAAMLAQKHKILPIILEFAKAAVAVLAQSAFFIVPFLYYSRQDFTMFSTDAAAMEAVLEGMFDFKTLINMVPKSIAEHGIRGSLGPSIVFAFIIGLILLAYNLATKKQWEQRKIFTFLSLGLTVMFAILATNKSLWEGLSQIDLFSRVASIVQYPFRFTGLVSFCVSLFTCLALATVKNSKIKYAVATVLCITAVFSAYTFFENVTVETKNNPRFHYYTDSPPEYMLKDAGTIFDIIAMEKKVTASEGVAITRYNKKSSNIDLFFENNVIEKGYIDVPLFYYTGYRAYMGKEKLEVTMGDLGVIRILLGDNQSGDIHLGYYGFWLFKLANIISLVSFGMMIWFIACKRKNSYNNLAK